MKKVMEFVAERGDGAVVVGDHLSLQAPTNGTRIEPHQSHGIAEVCLTVANAQLQSAKVRARADIPVQILEAADGAAAQHLAIQVKVILPVAQLRSRSRNRLALENGGARSGQTTVLAVPKG